jgi:hypothetical protein
MLLCHFTPLQTALGTPLTPGDCALVLGCLEPRQWCESFPDDVCVWFTSNPRPDPVMDGRSYIRNAARLPRTFRLRRALSTLSHLSGWMLDKVSEQQGARLLRAAKREWFQCYSEIPAEFFVGAEVTGAPWWFVGDVVPCAD